VYERTFELNGVHFFKIDISSVQTKSFCRRLNLVERKLV